MSGRPKKSSHDRKSRIVNIRFTEEDYTDIYQAADEAGMSLAEFIREVTTDEARYRVYGYSGSGLEDK